MSCLPPHVTGSRRDQPEIQQRDGFEESAAAIQIPGGGGQPADTLETLQVKEAALQEQYDKAVCVVAAT